MEKSIFKYPLQMMSNQVITIPFKSEILTVQVQFNKPMLLSMVDPSQTDTEERHIEIFGTGHPMEYNDDINRKYISTIQIDGGNYVFHVFERIYE